MTTRYRMQKNSLIKTENAGKNQLPAAETFDRAAIDKLLAQPGCTGLRIYFGMNEEMQLRAILIGVNESSKDILPADASTIDGSIVEDGKTCPPYCETDSPLNG